MVLRFGKRGKLSPHFMGLFEILECIGPCIGPVTYKLVLPPALATVHNVFHVSMLKKYIIDLSHMIGFEPLPLQVDLCYEECPTRILARCVKALRNKEISMVKVQ